LGYLRKTVNGVEIPAADFGQPFLKQNFLCSSELSQKTPLFTALCQTPTATLRAGRVFPNGGLWGH
jgi:hypothetical protein